MLGHGHGDFINAPTKEESEIIKGEGDKINCVDFRFERASCWRFRKGQDAP